MNKFFLVSLLISTAVNYGMEQGHESITIFTPEILPKFTQSLCATYNDVECCWQNDRRCGMGVDIGALSKTNKLLHNYYAQEGVKEQIISLCVPRICCSHQLVAWRLNCSTISKKMSRLVDIINRKNPFTEDDKKATWYLNMITVSGSLLYRAIKEDNLQAAQFIIDNASPLSFYYHGSDNVLKEIASRRLFCNDRNYDLVDQITLTEFLNIAQQLLKNGIDPDGRQDESSPTPLQKAVELKDEKYVYLLLWHAADPYKMTCFREGYNAFDCEQKEGWLQCIIDKVESDKKASLLLSQ